MTTDIDTLVSGPLPKVVQVGGYAGCTVRFAGNTGCCTCTYNYSMTPDEKHALARRITAALNYTSRMSIEEIEDFCR